VGQGPRPAEQVGVVHGGVIPDLAKGKPLEIWFQDEARVGQKGTLAYVWARGRGRGPCRTRATCRPTCSAPCVRSAGSARAW